MVFFIDIFSLIMFFLGKNSRNFEVGFGVVGIKMDKSWLFLFVVCLLILFLVEVEIKLIV